MSRSIGHRSPIASLDRIAELAQTLAPLLEDAADAGARKSGGIEFVGRGRGFTDVDPTWHSRPGSHASSRCAQPFGARSLAEFSALRMS